MFPKSILVWKTLKYSLLIVGHVESTDTPGKTLSLLLGLRCLACDRDSLSSFFEQVNNLSGLRFWHVLLGLQANCSSFLVFQPHLTCKTANNMAKSIESMPLSTFWVYWYLHLWYKQVLWEPPFLLPDVCFHRREARQLRGKEAALVLDLLAQHTGEQAHHQIEDIDKETKFIWNH